MLPKGLGLITGIALGFTFIAGGIESAVTGWLADIVGIERAVHGIMWLPLISAAFTLLIPAENPAPASPAFARPSTSSSSC